MNLGRTDFTGLAILAGVVVVGIAGWQLFRGAKAIGSAVGSAVSNAGGALVDAAGSVATTAGTAASATVEGIGGIVGIPRTDDNRCTEAMARGGVTGWWSATFDCPAKRLFSGALFGDEHARQLRQDWAQADAAQRAFYTEPTVYAF